MIWAFAIRFGKRFVFVISLLLAIASLLLTACGSGENSNVYEVEHNGKVFTVDQVNQTITVDGYICSFEVSGGRNHMEFNVTYPDGSTYWWSQGGGVGQGGWSEAYDPDRYVAGDVLWDVLSMDRRADENDSGKYIGPGIFLILLGAVNVAGPHMMWYLGYGWRYKNAEPSDMALIAERAGGIIAIVFGAICLLV